MRVDPGLAVQRDSPYVYRSAFKRIGASALDALGDLALKSKRPPIDWARIRSVGVLRLDHLGDLLFLFPALQALRHALPHVKLTLYVGPWGAAVARMAPGVDTIAVVPAPWFARPTRQAWPLAAITTLADTVRAGEHDLVIEPRGELRHMAALARAGVPLRLGHAVTAGRFFLTHSATWDAGLHEVDQTLSLLAQAGLPGVPAAGLARPRLVPGAKARAEASRVLRKLKLRRGFVAVQAACGAASKRWMPERWAQLLSSLPKGQRVVLLGDASERAEMLTIAKATSPRPAVAAGLLSLEALAALLESARLLISVDSGPAHLAAAVGTPVLGLYSGTNLVSQWGPRAECSRVLKAATACSPCELNVCPYDNECMRRLDVASVLLTAREMLAHGGKR